MELNFKDTRNNKMRKTNPDGKSHKYGEDYEYMLKNYLSIQKAKEAVEKNIQSLKAKQETEELTVDEFYTGIEWNKKAENIIERERILVERLF